MSNSGSAKIGHKQDKHGNVKAYNRFKRDFADLLDEQILELADDEVEDMRDDIEEIANRELQEYFTTVASKMGLAEKPYLRGKGSITLVTYDVFSRVVWFPLSERTRKIKRKRAGDSAANVKWYSFNKTCTGGEPLKDYLNGLSFNEGCIVDLNKDERSAKQYHIRISIPLDEDSIIDEMDEAQAAKAFFDSGRGGVNEERRPIFNPVAEYFVRQRIPRKIMEELGVDVG